MPTSLATFRTDLTEAVLDFLVDQWRRLNGAIAGSEAAAFVIDPEVLVALTSSLGRYDSRVFDTMVDWLGSNGRLINVQRLFRLVEEDGYADPAAVGASLGYNHMQVRTVLQAIEQAGIAASRPQGRTLQYSIDADVWGPVLVGPAAAVEWVAWRRLARGIHGIVTGLWSIDADRADPSLAASLIRDVMRRSRDDILQGHPRLSHPTGRARLLGKPLARHLAALEGS